MRVRLGVEGDLYDREAPAMSVDLDFNALVGHERTLRAGSPALVEVESGERREIALAQEAELRHASGNPALRIEWTGAPLGRFEKRAWDLYFATVPRGAEGAWEPLERTYTVGKPGVLWDTSFEEADPEHEDRPVGMHPGGWDKEGETTERVWTDEEALTGEYCLKIARTFEGESPTNSNRPHWRSWPPRMAVRPGQTVRASMWIKATEFGEGSSCGGMLEFYGPENERLSEGRARLRGPQVPQDWTEVSATTVVPEGAAGAVIWFSLYNEGVAYCDDVLVTVASGATMPDLPVETGPVIRRMAVQADEGPPQEEKILRSGVAETPPTIDGALDDSAWEAAGSVRDFLPFLQVPGTEVTTTVRACADRDALYFGFECTEPDTADLIAETQERDGPVWQDDSVELFLDTNRDRRTFYQIIVNPKGIFFDQDTGTEGLAGPKWDGPITVAAQTHPDRWVAEVKLEFAGLRLGEAEGQVWGANFARTSHRGGRSAYSWARVESGFLEPENFGRLVLPFDPTANVVTGRVRAVETLYRGAGTLPFEVTNRRDVAVPVIVRVTRQDDGVAEVRATIEAGETSGIEVPMRFDESGEVALRYDLLDAGDGTLFHTTEVTHTVPQALEVWPDHLVSYLDEQALTGRWHVGLAESALEDARLAMEVRAGDDAVATETVQVRATEGAYAVGVGEAGEGAYVLEVRLEQAGQTVAEREVAVERMQGPFAE
ncbi:MAG: hypothetical protein GF393_12530 [Armatimonadia bacterium]|nr:hypothetical protein [Armatimonadia bacterium]